MLVNKSYTSNKSEELVNLQGEVIKGYINHDKKHYIIFESGFGFWFNSNGAFVIESPEEINKVVDKAKGRLISTKLALENVLKIAGESI